MQNLSSVGFSNSPTIQMVKQKNGNPYSTNFKAGEVDQYVRGDSSHRTGSSRQPMTQEEAMMKMIKDRQEAQKKAQRKQKWMNALSIAGVLSGIVLCGFFIWQGTRGNKKAVDDAERALTDVNIKWTTFTGDNKVASLDSETTSSKVKERFQSIVNMDKLSDKKKKWCGIKDRSRLYYMYGESGVGKTYAVQQLAQEMGAEYTCIKYGDLGSPYKDAGSMKILNMFRKIGDLAAQNPDKKYVVCIDEIDSLLLTVGEKSSDEASKARGSVLTGMDELVRKCKNVVLVGTSNYHPDSSMIDKASIRRFNKGKIEVPLPDKVQVKALLKMYLKDVEAIKPEFFEKPEFASFVDDLVAGKYANGEIENIAKNAAEEFGAAAEKIADADIEGHLFKVDFLKKAKEMLGQAAAISNRTMTAG